MDYFVYINAKGEVKSYCLHEISESNDYIQAIHHGVLKTFRQDRVIWRGACESEAAKVAETSQHITLPKPPKAPSHNLLEVCFTGFTKTKKAELTTASEAAKCLVRQSVTSNLDILCCGNNAGPKKVHAARRDGVLILTEQQFKYLLETGEIPDSNE